MYNEKLTIFYIHLSEEALATSALNVINDIKMPFIGATPQNWYKITYPFKVTYQIEIYVYVLMEDQ